MNTARRGYKFFVAHQRCPRHSSPWWGFTPRGRARLGTHIPGDASTPPSGGGGFFRATLVCLCHPAPYRTPTA
ncbi:MAG: hypothetical protein IJX88_05315 [Clostridia bacterium]|nr:hypothetical protein [Clostridia bacterium]